MRVFRRRPLVLLTAVALLAALALPVSAETGDRDPSAKQDRFSTTSYIVQLVDAPVAGYTGGIAGLDATAPAAGKKINPNDAKVKKYVAHLAKRHADVAAAVGATTSKFYDYYYAFDGFAATLTKSQVNALRERADVASVEADRLAHVDTDNTPQFLGLTGPSGLWQQLGGQNMAGDGVVIGIVDTGIWPEHPSFSDQTNLGDPSGSSGKRTLSYGPPPPGWSGGCQSGEQFSQDNCNRKLIGARYYLSGFGHFGVVKDDFKSARDADGHGTHTASTAGGNANVSATVLGSNLGVISGMAPRARIASYKVCWNSEAGGCASSDSVAAIDQAVADGVDVINFSISGTSSNFLDPVEVAFLFANRAGVFVAASAGNSGPGASTVNHPSPWLTTVAASTHDRSFKGTVTFGGTTKSGVTLTSGTSTLPLVDSVAAARSAAAADVTAAELCFVGALNPSVVTGKIVLCKRGVTARVDKSLAVKNAGGLGMVLYNASDTQSLNTDNHWIPSLHVNFTDGMAVKAYITAAGAGAQASLSGGARVSEGGNTMADFSSRGPTRGASGNILKPDVTAPGVNVLAGNSPTAFLGAEGQMFQSIGGTSMSSPHVAGIAALLRQAHPSWTAAAIRSALMTSARQDVKKEDGVTPASPFDFGAGHIAPKPANDPGLVYDVSFNDYLGFLKAMGLCCATLPSITPIAASDLNQASIAIGALAGTQTTTRRVTNVGGSAATYGVSVTAPTGVDVTVTPTSLTIAAGATATYTVKFDTNSSATFNSYAFGSLTWSDGTHSVRSPIAIRPVRLAAPASVSGTGVSSTTPIEYTVRFGYNGTFTTAPRGLVPATKTAASVTDDPTNNFDTANPNDNQGIRVHEVVVPANTKHARFSLFNAYADGQHDLDLYVYRVGATGTLTLVGLSAGGTADEEVNLVNPTAATYRAYVHGWQTAGGGTANYTFFNWLVGDTSVGNLTITAPGTAVSGTSGTVSLSWAGLTAGTRYLGFVSYGDGTNEIGRTIVSIRTD